MADINLVVDVAEKCTDALLGLFPCAAAVVAPLCPWAAAVAGAAAAVAAAAAAAVAAL